MSNIAPPDGCVQLPGDPPISLLLRRSTRAKRMSLRISNLDGRVTLTAPVWESQSEAQRFALSQEAWIRRHLEVRPTNVVVRIGEQIPLCGQQLIVTMENDRAVQVYPDAIALPGPPDQIGQQLSAYLKEAARDHLTKACDHYATRLGKPYTKMTLRDTRTRWGSCASNGKLMFSWRLIMAPPHVLNYVAAHEVAHLKQMNHSPAFWAQVERIYGPYDDARQWLRAHGGHLHRYQF